MKASVAQAASATPAATDLPLGVGSLPAPPPCDSNQGPRTRIFCRASAPRQAGLLTGSGEGGARQMALSQYELYAENAVIPFSLSLPAYPPTAVLHPFRWSTLSDEQRS